MVISIVPRKFTVSDDVSYLGMTYDPRSPYPEKVAVNNAIISIGPTPVPPGDWYYTDFRYRKLITITNNIDTKITNAPVLISINIVTDKMNSDWSDIRFTYTDAETGREDAIYYLKEYSDQQRARFWLQVPSIPASAQMTCYIYYGDSTASNAENWSWMYASYNFETDEGLTWIDNGVPENYGNDAGELRSSLSRIDFVSLKTGRETFVYKGISLGTNDFRMRVKAKFSSSANSPLFALSEVAEIKAGLPSQKSIGVRFGNSKAEFIKTYGSTRSTTHGNNVISAETYVILEMKKIGSVIYVNVKSNSYNSTIESLPDQSLTGYEASRNYAHPVLGDLDSIFADGACDIFIVTKAYSSDPSYSIGDEEVR